MKPRIRSLTLEPLEDRTLMSTCHVTRLSDIGAGMGFRGDLRYCINKVNAEPGPDVIDFNVTGTINLSSALPNLASDIDIQGPGAELLTVRRDTGGNYRIFTVPFAPLNVQLSGLTIANGRLNGTGATGAGVYTAGHVTIRDSIVANNTVANAFQLYHGYGGGIYNAGQLTLIDSTVANNATASDLNAYGGGIYNTAQLTVIDSTIARNVAAGFLYAYGGGICNRGLVSIYNSTISNNSAPIYGLGGALYNDGGTMTVFNSTVSNNSSSDSAVIVSLKRFHAGGSLIISHSTITSNTTNYPNEANAGGGAIYVETPLFMRNTIVAANSPWDIYGTLTASDHNLIGNTTNGAGFSGTDLLNVNPMLGPLADNGGPTRTRALLPGSPAIDAGDNGDAPEFDQRGPGFPRIVNGTIDIGAFEVQSTGAPALAPGSRTPFGNTIPETPFRVSAPRLSVEQSRRIETEFLEHAFPNGVRERGEAAERGATLGPFQRLVHGITTRPGALPWGYPFRPVGSEGDLEMFS